MMFSTETLTSTTMYGILTTKICVRLATDDLPSHQCRCIGIFSARHANSSPVWIQTVSSGGKVSFSAVSTVPNQKNALKKPANINLS